jgi:transposase
MVKSTHSIQQHINGNKGNIFLSHLRSKNLENVMVIPLEIGKSYHKALIANYFGSLLKGPFEFHNSQEGIQFLHKAISDISKHQPVEQVVIGMEATGHYFKMPAAMLHEAGYSNLFILNPLSTSYCRKAGLTWTKTDDEDLRAIGQALICGYGNPYQPEKPLWEDLKEACRHRRFLVGYQTRLKNKIHAKLDLLLPGISELAMFSNNHLCSPASLDFFVKYPDLESIRHLTPKGIIKFFQGQARRISPEMASSLIQWSNNALDPHSQATDCRKFIFKALIEQLKKLSQDISQIEVKLTGYLVQTPAVLLLSIDYIGPVRAAEFAGEISPLDQYPESGALIKAAGLDSTRYQSSTLESPKRPTSKKGSRRLRYITIEIADSLMRQNQHFAYFSNKLLEKGKSKDCSCVATGSRFIRTAFWMIKEQKPFQPPDGLGISEEPLAKITTFLQAHHVSDLNDEYVGYAKKYFTKGEKPIPHQS